MQKLILVGASVRGLAQSALRAGFAPFAIDLFADRDLAAVCPAVRIKHYPGDFLHALADAPQAPWLYTGGLENHPRLVDRLASIRPLLGNGGNVLRRVRDPVLLAGIVREAGLQFPAAERVVSQRLTGAKWLVKRRRSSGGVGVHFASADELRRPPRGAYLQPYIDGQSASAVFVAAGREARLVGVTRQLLGCDFHSDRAFVYAGSMGPLELPESTLAKVCSLGNVLAERLGLVGLFNADFVIRDDELWLVEINPRYSASIEILERITEMPVIGLHVTACREDTLADVPIANNRRFAGKAVVYARTPCTIGPAIDQLINQWNAPGQWPLLADLPHAGQSFTTGQPVLTVLAEGQSIGDVERILHDRVAAVEQLLPSAGTGFGPG